MVDREKVIKTLEDFNKNRICLPHLIPWNAIADAITMLKEQETVKPTADDTEGLEPYAQGDGSWACNNCGETVGCEEMGGCGIRAVKYKYCPECGMAVKWE